MLRTLLLVMLLSAAAQAAAEKPVINWYKTDIAPFYIATGEMKGKGAGDEIQTLLEKEFPDYENRTLYANERRRIKDIGKYENFITFGLLTEERKKSVLYSHPVMVSKSAELIYKKKNAAKVREYMNSSGEIELDRLIAGGRVTIGYCRDRAFSDTVNAILERNQDVHSLQPLLSQNAVEANIRKLDFDRLDCIIENGTVVEYTKRVFRLPLDYAKTRIKGMRPYAYVYAIFPPNDFGREAQKRINRLLEKKRYDEGYINITGKWTTPEDNYRRLYIDGIRAYFEGKP